MQLGVWEVYGFNYEDLILEEGFDFFGYLFESCPYLFSKKECRVPLKPLHGYVPGFRGLKSNLAL